MPAIYLTNAASVAAVARGNAKPETAACVGPGPVLSIMRFPRDEMGEAGVGRVLALTPPQRLAAPAIAAKKAADARTDDAKADGIAARWRAYEEALRATWEPRLEKMAPGSLAYGRSVGERRPSPLSLVQFWDGAEWEYLDKIPDGATLICACSRQAAAAGRCHRVIAADLLKRAGWSVVLDGRSL